MASERLEEWRQHWPVALGAAVVAGTGQSVWPYVMSGFVQPMQTAFGWSRAEIALAMNAALIGSFLAPYLGRLADRHGVRPVLLFGNIVVGLSYIALANNPGSLTIFYLASGGVAIGGIATSAQTFTRAIASWFDASRGLALATTRIGVTITTAFLPMLMFAVMSRFGWQTGYYVMAALSWVICAPVAWFFVRDRRDNPATLSHSVQKPAGFAAALAVCTNWRVLTVCFAIGGGYGAMMGVLSQLQPLLVSHGIDKGMAANLIGFTALSTFVAAIAAGFLLDRIWGPLIGFIATLTPVAGCVILMGDHLDSQSALIAVLLIGVAAGAEADLSGYLVARYFGMQSYSLIMGMQTLIVGLFISVSAYAVGQMFDIFGEFRESLIIISIVYAVAAMAFLLLGPYPKREESTAQTRARVIAVPAE